MSEARADWLEPDAPDLQRVAGKHAGDLDVQRLIRIAKDASWIVRMHEAFNGTFGCKATGGVRPPLLAWDGMVEGLRERKRS